MTNFLEKTLTKSEYFIKTIIGAFLTLSKVI